MLFLNTDAIGFLIASIIIGIGNPFAGVSVFSYACEYSKKNKDIPKFQALREFGLNLGRIITITTVMFFSFEIAFLIPIIGTIIFLFLIKEWPHSSSINFEKSVFYFFKKWNIIAKQNHYQSKYKIIAFISFIIILLLIIYFII